MVNTRENILDVTQNLIQKKGINGFSFSDIAELVKIKKASIYYYFSSKSELILAVLNNYQDLFFQSLAKNENDSMIETLNFYISLFRENLAEEKICLCSYLAMDINNLTDDVKESVDNFFSTNIRWIEKRISSYGYSHNDAIEFFSIIQGAQIISRNFNSITYFNNIVSNYLEKYKNKEGI